jgi:hypothetical protein
MAVVVLSSCCYLLFLLQYIQMLNMAASSISIIAVVCSLYVLCIALRLYDGSVFIVGNWKQQVWGQGVESMAHHHYLHYARRMGSWHQVHLKKQPVHYADIFTTGTIALSCIKLLMGSSLLLTTQRERKTPPGCVCLFILEHVK